VSARVRALLRGFRARGDARGDEHAGLAAGDRAGRRRGVRMVQFIGGEPTLHPDLPRMIEHALAHDVMVEVYSNLLHVTDRMWELFRRPGVSLATSWYSCDPVEHQQIVGGNKHAYRRTLANIGLAVAYGIPIRVGVISFSDQQHVDGALAQLDRLGITRRGVDHVRGVGRGAHGQEPNVDALCGQCADGKLAITPHGDAFPCVFSRWPQMQAGNILHQSLAEIITGIKLTTTRHQLQHHFDQRPGARVCRPDGDGCQPYCVPNCCAPTCSPDARQAGEGLARSTAAARCDPDDPCGPSDGCSPNCEPMGSGGCDPSTCAPCLPDVG